MKNLEHQERLLQFITEFDNIHGYHLYKRFFNNLKSLVDQIKSKNIEMLEDFSEKMERFEYLNYLKKMKIKFLEWKLKAEEAKKMDMAKDFYEKKMKIKIMTSLKKSHMFSKKILKLIKRKLSNDKKQFLDILYNNKLKTDELYSKAVNKLDELFKDNDYKLKKENFYKMKMFDFMDHLKDLKDILDDKHKKEFLKRLNRINDYYILKDSFIEWKNAINKKKFYKKLIRLKKKELEKKKNFTIDSNVNNLKVLDKNQDDDKNNSPIKIRSNEISISNENSINILKKGSPQKLLSIGNAGLDFSIIAPEIYYIKEVETSQKMPRIENINNTFEKVLSMINNIKLKKYFKDWKNRAYLNKIIKKLKDYKNREKKINNVKKII